MNQQDQQQIPDQINVVLYTLYNQLIQQIFERDIQEIKVTLQSVKEQNLCKILNIQDSLGNTPLLLNILVNGSFKQVQQEITEILLSCGSNPNIQNNEHYTAYYAAVMQKNYSLALHLFNKQKKQSFVQQEIQRKKHLDKQLKELKNFYIVMKYEIDNHYIPFIQYLCPSDKIKVWKVDNQIQSIQTFAGYKKNTKFKTIQRKQIHFYYNPQNQKFKRNHSQLFSKSQVLSEQQKNEQQEISNNIEHIFQDKILFAVPDFKIYAAPQITQTNTTYVQNHVKLQHMYENAKLKIKQKTNKTISKKFLLLEDIKPQPSQNIWGNPVKDNINGYKTQKFDLHLNCKICQMIENPTDLNMEFNEYKQKHMPSSEDNVFLNNEEEVFNKPLKFRAYQIVDNKKMKLQMWTTKDHPLDPLQFMGVMEFLVEMELKRLESEGFDENPILKNFLQLLTNKTLQEYFKLNGMPIKIQVPLPYGFYAVINFKNFRDIVDRQLEIQQMPDLFTIPENFKRVSMLKAKQMIEGTSGKLNKYNENFEEEKDIQKLSNSNGKNQQEHEIQIQQNQLQSQIPDQMDNINQNQDESDLEITYQDFEENYFDEFGTQDFDDFDQNQLQVKVSDQLEDLYNQNQLIDQLQKYQINIGDTDSNNNKINSLDNLEKLNTQVNTKNTSTPYSNKHKDQNLLAPVKNQIYSCSAKKNRLSQINSPYKFQIDQ